jgi:hypothetical protein
MYREWVAARVLLCDLQNIALDTDDWHQSPEEMNARAYGRVLTVFVHPLSV